ncbi:hypothetical protein Mal35_26490 [Gimesia maris]|uniref:hypothetical protein n=1 Tax=Gimesia maris TaxID=122 RepID=UPI0011877C95|nr:hypothetical protein [Gimesia maris]QDT79194.1 hypothetical protein Mal35_26490 [Gimesia maris]
MNQQNPDKRQILIDGLEPPEIEPRGYLHKLKLDFDPDAQLREIHKLLVRNQQVDQEFDRETTEIEESLSTIQQDDDAESERAEMIDATVIGNYHEATYQSIAHSMAAVGMLAPFMESMLHQCFLGMKSLYSRESIPGLADDTRYQLNVDAFWDCHFIFSKNGKRNTNIVDGTMQLSESTGLDLFLPVDFLKVLGALVAYRNVMFHNGMEWPADQRDKFQNRIKNDKWPVDWFDLATTGEEKTPWMFFMTDKFIERCLRLADEVLEAFGALVKSLEEQK